MSREHLYKLSIIWTGNKGEGTSEYKSYERSHRITAANKPDILGSSDPAFRGDLSCWNPEELLVASISSCHMLWYLHLCSDNKIVVVSYQDEPEGKMIINGEGIGKFSLVTLNPVVKITNNEKKTLAMSLHKLAHEKCFIANSINFEINFKPVLLTV